MPEEGFTVMSHGLLTMALACKTPEVMALRDQYETLKEDHNDCLDNEDQRSAGEPRANDHVCKKLSRRKNCCCHYEQNVKCVLDDIFNGRDHRDRVLILFFNN